jgi:hypothetical protein
MRKFRNHWLVLAALSITIPQAYAAPEAKGEPRSFNSFKAVFTSLTESTDRKDLELAKAGDADAKKQKFATAAAEYLAAAQAPLSSNNFEAARTDLDKAFLIAAKLSSDDQKEMLQALSQIVSKSFHQLSPDAYKYLAQQRLKLMRNNPGASPDSQFNEVRTVAFSCSSHKRYNEAISLLQETLKDLQTIQPPPENIGWCEDALARVYDQSGDAANAKKCYELWLQFARTLKKNDQLCRVLGQYLHFLFDHQMTDQVVALSEEFFKISLSPEQIRWKDRISLEYYAQKLSGIDVDESDKFYREAFNNEKQMNETAMNSGYGRTIARWAEMLNRAGRSKQALAVLQEGMEFCRHSKWPDAVESYMPEMQKEFEAVLASSGNSKDIDEAHKKFDAELSSNKNKHKVLEEQKWKATMDNPKIPAYLRVEALTERSDREFKDKQCENAISHLKQAVDVYETNSGDPASEQMYSCFLDIRLNLEQCGKEKEIEPLLLRIIRSGMINGFKDPLAAASGSSFCVIGRRPASALEDYIGPGGPLFRPQLDSPHRKKLEQLLGEAKSSNKPEAVVFFLSRLRGFNEPEAIQIETAEELEKWRAKEIKPWAMIAGLLQSAEIYLTFKKYDIFLHKWETVKSLSEQLTVAPTKEPVPYSLAGVRISQSAARFGETLFADNQLEVSKQLFLESYRYSLQDEWAFQTAQSRESVKLFALDLAKANDKQGGNDILKQGLKLAQAKYGDESGETRAWLINTSEYYIKTEQSKEAKATMKLLIASIVKSGMSIAPRTRELLTNLEKILTSRVYAKESKKIRQLLK